MDSIYGATGARYEYDENRTLKGYVFTTEEILRTCKWHGLVEARDACIVLSADRPIDPHLFAEAASHFADKLNELLAARGA